MQKSTPGRAEHSADPWVDLLLEGYELCGWRRTVEAVDELVVEALADALIGDLGTDLPKSIRMDLVHIPPDTPLANPTLVDLQAP